MDQSSFLPVKHAFTKRSDSTSTIDSVSQFSDPSFEFNAMKRQLFKTKVCRHFLTGKCKYSSNCTFAHSKTDLKLPPDFRKSRLCQKGNCNDPSCQYAHSSSEIRNTYSEMCPHWLKGSCPHGSSCKLSHNLTHLEEMAIASSLKSDLDDVPVVDNDTLITPTFQVADSNAIDLVEALLQMLSGSPNLVSDTV